MFFYTLMTKKDTGKRGRKKMREREKKSYTNKNVEIYKETYDQLTRSHDVINAVTPSNVPKIQVLAMAINYLSNTLMNGNVEEVRKIIKK